jgi:hypothetical protein
VPKGKAGCSPHKPTVEASAAHPSLEKKRNFKISVVLHDKDYLQPNEARLKPLRLLLRNLHKGFEPLKPDTVPQDQPEREGWTDGKYGKVAENG